MNNLRNQLQTKVNTRIQRHMETLYINVEKLEQKNDLHNEMIQITYLEGVGYCEHRHYCYPYIGQTNNNF